MSLLVREKLRLQSFRAKWRRRCAFVNHQVFGLPKAAFAGRSVPPVPEVSPLAGRAEFTTTLLLQEPSGGGEFLYRTDLRSDSEPNHDGVASVLQGRDGAVKSHVLKSGTLNVFGGKNTLHKVTQCQGPQSRFIAVFSYYERPGVRFTRDEQVGFYGLAV